MVTLYAPPEDYLGKEVYERVLNSPSEENIQATLYVCAYKIQNYINAHYFCDCEDIIQETIANVMEAIHNYKSDIPFWTYVYQTIKWASIKSYRTINSMFSMSADVQRKAKKVVDDIEDGISVEEAAKKHNIKKTTAINYYQVHGRIAEIEETIESIPVEESESEPDCKLDDIKKVLDTMDRETKYILTAYLQNCTQKDWKNPTLEICRRKGLPDRKVLRIIQQFKKECQG